MTCRTVEGQALDLGWARDGRYDITPEDYLTMAIHKTAHYSGAVPLAVGAIVGGADDEIVEALRSYGLDTGLAFQIQDDLLNLVGTDEAKKKDFRSDITEGKRTLVVVHALQNAAPRTRRPRRASVSSRSCRRRSATRRCSPRPWPSWRRRGPSITPAPLPRI